MVGTYLIYTSLLLVGIGGAKIIISANKRNSRRRTILMFLFLFILSIPIGGRYEVGSDWENYRELFLDVNKHGLSSFQEIFNSNYESFYLGWNYIVSCISHSSSFFFTCTAFLIFLLIYKANKGYEYLFPLVLFFFFCSILGASMNIIRQVLATAIFYYAFAYSDNKWKMLVVIVFSILTHYSSVLFLIALILNHKYFKVLDNPKFVVLLYLICFLLGSSLYSLFIKYLPTEIMSEKYLSSMNSKDSFSLSSGLGIIATNGINVILMLTSAKVKSFFSNGRVDLMYRCYFVGCFLSAFMGYSIFLSRVPFGLTNIKIFLLAYTIYYLSKRQTILKLLLKTSIIFLYVLFFIMGIFRSDNGCSPYIFNWL